VGTTCTASYNSETFILFFFMLFIYSLSHNKPPHTHIYFLRKLRFLLQAQGVLCEVRTECHVDLLEVKYKKKGPSLLGSSPCRLVNKNNNTEKFISLNITDKMQLYTIFFITVNAVHVSGGFSAHHQKLKNCKHSIWYMSSLLADQQASLTYTGCCVYSF